MTWIVEDWGTTLGTAGTLGWTKTTGSGWNQGGWNWHIGSSGSRFSLVPVGVVVDGAFGASSPDGFKAAYGTPTGSQFIMGTASNVTTGEMLYLTTAIAQYDGTTLYWGGGCHWTGAQQQFIFRAWTKAGVNGSFVVAHSGAVENAGAWTSVGPHTFTTAYHGDGSWSGTVQNLSTGSIGMYSAGLGANYAAETLDQLTIGFFANNCMYYLYRNSIEYEVYVPPVETIVQFIGTWAGGGSGTYNWGQDVIGYPGDVQDRAYGPADSTGWASTVSVTLDDSRGAWGSFAGTSTLPYEGTWILRKYWAGLGTGGATGSWVTLLTGFVEPENLTYDYQRKTAKLTLQSTIARAAQTVARMDGTISGPCEQELVGTITYADADTGTVRIGNHTGNVWEVEGGCSLWGTTGTSTQSIRVGSTITPVGDFTYGGTGTLTVDGEFPPWLAVGAPAWVTLPWPSYVDRRNPSVFVPTLVNSLGLTWPSDNAQVFAKQAAYGAIAPNGRLYGGEKLTTALSGIMKAINGFYSVDPSGNFRARCLLPNVSVSGTVDFNAAYDSEWQMSYEPAHSGVEVECSYNVDSGSYTEHVSVGGTQTWGDIKSYELQWLGSGIEAQSMAGRLYRNAYLPRPSLTLRLAGSAWATYLPGEVYAIHNLPAQLTTLLAGTSMILYSRTYDWADDLTAFEFVSMPGGNYAVWDGTPADFWEGSGKVWF